MNPDQLLTLHDVAQETRFAVKTLYRFLAPRGDLPCIRVTNGPTSLRRRTHGAIRVRRSDLEAWLARHRSAPQVEVMPARRVATGRFS